MAEMISIVIPTFNRPRLLKETLESVRIQTYPEWECLIVDDGSDDQTAEVAMSFVKTDKRFQFIGRSRPPKGASTCRNIGLAQSKGEYVVFLDSGDLLSPDCLSGRLQTIRENMDCDFWVSCTAEFRTHAGDGDVLINVPTREDPILRFLKMDVMWLATGPIWKKSTMEELQGWDERLLSWQDWELSLRALILGKSFRYFPVTDNFWRMMDGAISNASLAPEHLESHVYALNKIRDLLKKENILSKFIHPMNVLYFWIAMEWSRIKRFRESMHTWKQAPTTSRIKKIYFLLILLFLNMPILHSIVYRLFIRLHPSYIDLFGGTYRKVQYHAQPETNVLLT